MGLDALGAFVTTIVCESHILVFWSHSMSFFAHFESIYVAIGDNLHYFTKFTPNLSSPLCNVDTFFLWKGNKERNTKNKKGPKINACVQ